MLADIKRIVIDNKKSELESEIKRLELELKEVDTKIKEVEQLISDCRAKAERERNKLFNRIVNRIIAYKSKTSKEIDIEEENLDFKKTKLENERKEILKKIDDVKFKIEKIGIDHQLMEDSSNLMVLNSNGLNFKSACELLKSKNIPIVLDESDLFYNVQELSNSGYATHDFKAQPKENVDLSVMKDYVLVHKTDYYPKNGRISTSKEASEPVVKNFALDKLGSVSTAIERNTIHFAVNGEVGDHEFGDWKDRKYAVLIPFPDMPISQFRCGAAVDTYIEGGLNLPSSAIILCPVEELEMVKRENPNQTVIGYKGKNVTKYADAMVSYLGYKVEKVGKWSWDNGKDAGQYYENLEQTGLNIHTSRHYGTIEFYLEENIPKVKNFIIAIKRILENNIILTSEELKVFMDDLLICFGIDKEYFQPVKSLFEKELSPYGIIIPEINDEFLSSVGIYGIGSALRSNIINQAMQIVQNNIKSRK